MSEPGDQNADKIQDVDKLKRLLRKLEKFPGLEQNAPPPLSGPVSSTSVVTGSAAQQPPPQRRDLPRVLQAEARDPKVAGSAAEPQTGSDRLASAPPGAAQIAVALSLLALLLASLAAGVLFLGLDRQTDRASAPATTAEPRVVATKSGSTGDRAEDASLPRSSTALKTPRIAEETSARAASTSSGSSPAAGADMSASAPMAAALLATEATPVAAAPPAPPAIALAPAPMSSPLPLRQTIQDTAAASQSGPPTSTSDDSSPSKSALLALPESKIAPTQPVATLAIASPRVVGPSEWPAPPGLRTRLPLVFEPAADAHRYHVLLIGLEATASVAKGVEIVEGTWMLRAADFAGVVIERRANLPARKTVVIEVRTDTGSVVSRTEFVLLGAAKPGT